MTEKNQHFRVRFWAGGGGNQKAYAVYAFVNVDNCERPLSKHTVYNQCTSCSVSKHTVYNQCTSCSVSKHTVYNQLEIP